MAFYESQPNVPRELLEELIPHLNNSIDRTLACGARLMLNKTLDIYQPQCVWGPGECNMAPPSPNISTE
jgi:hypothetical protein